MKFIVIGLGNFGASLCGKLSAHGHEVIGVDSNLKRVELNQDQMTHGICADTTDDQAIRALPIQEADCVIIGIGEDVGASIMTAALLKQQQPKKLLCRVISPLHLRVLEAMGIDEFVHPEAEAAERLASKFDVRGAIDSFSLGEDYKIIEATVPEHYIGQTILEVDFRNKYRVNILTIIKVRKRKGIFGLQTVQEVVGVVSPNMMLEAGDILVLFGHIRDIQTIINSD